MLIKTNQMANNLSIYLKHKTPILEELYNKLLIKKFNFSDTSRAVILADNEIARFLTSFKLKQGEEITGGKFWAKNPELAFYDAFEKRMFRHEIAREDGQDLNDDQIILLCEFQGILFTQLLAFSEHADEIFEMSNDGVFDHTIARFAMIYSCNSLWNDIDFWRFSSAPARIFHQRLLSVMKALLVRTYEGKYSTASVWLIDENVSSKLRWTKFSLSGLEFISKTKMGRVLTSKESNVSAFYSSIGEFFGLFDVDHALEIMCLSKSIDLPLGSCEWRISRPGCLQLFVNGAIRLEYQDGFWRYVNRQADYLKLCSFEESFLKDNKIIWDVVLAQSDRRKSSIILVVESEKQILKDRVCSKSDLNIKGNSRLPKRKSLKEFTKENPVWLLDDVDPKDFLLEQIRENNDVSKIGFNVLVQFSSIDGAMIVNKQGCLLGFGVILQVGGKQNSYKTEGAGARAVRLVSKYGVAIKISEDGPISIFHKGTQLN